MLRECAPGSQPKVTTHSILVEYNGKIGQLPKGPGQPRKADPQHFSGVLIYPQKARKIAEHFGLSPDCVGKYFPGLMR